MTQKTMSRLPVSTFIGERFRYLGTGPYSTLETGKIYTATGTDLCSIRVLNEWGTEEWYSTRYFDSMRELDEYGYTSEDRGYA